MAIPVIKTSFAAGELAPGLWGVTDYAKYKLGLSTCRNAFISCRGGAYSRAGTAFVGYSRQTGQTVPPRLIRFQFSLQQGLILEIGNFYFRVISDGGFVLESAFAITGITNAPLGVVTSPGNNFASGDWVFIQGVDGMTEVNGQTYVVGGVSGSTFQLMNIFGQAVDTVPFPAYLGGGTVARVFTSLAPWAQADLKWLKWTQSADTMSICCWNQETGTTYPPYELKRIADDNWSVGPLSTGATNQPPVSIDAFSTNTTTGGASNPITFYAFQVTTVDQKSGVESVASAIALIDNSVDVSVVSGTLVVQWQPQPGQNYYNVYQAEPLVGPGSSGAVIDPGSLFGFVGSTYGGQINLTNVTPDFDQVPPLHSDPFAPGQILFVEVTSGGSGITSITAMIGTSGGTGFQGYGSLVNGSLAVFVVVNPGQNYEPGDTISFTVNGGATAPVGTLSIGPETGTYPSVVAYFQQRRFYASTPNQPDTYFGSQPGAFTNYDSRVPTIDSDAIVGTPWAVQVNGIQQMIPMPGGLVVLTGQGAWQLGGAGSSPIQPQAITPANQQAEAQAFNGCSAYMPAIPVYWNIIYLQSLGSIFRDLAYNIYAGIYTGLDITYLSSHLFTGFQMRESAWCEEPFKLIWVVRADGLLLCLTYFKEQEVVAWTRHDTLGLTWSIASVIEPPVNALYLATERTVTNNLTSYMIERQDNRSWSGIETTWCVDAGLSLPQPTPAANITISYSDSSGLLMAGQIAGLEDFEGGSNYGAVVITVRDPSGTGAVITAAVVNGVVQAPTVVSPGSGYTDPVIVFTDPTGTGTLASATAVVQSLGFVTADANVFSVSSVGRVIRAASGIAVVTTLRSATIVEISIIQPFTSANPSPLLFTVPNGSWTMTEPVSSVRVPHLGSSMVTGLADGVVIPPQVAAADGTVTLAQPASNIVIGLPFQVQLQTLRPEMGQPTTQGQRKIVGGVTARVEQSLGFEIGVNQPDGSALSPQQFSPPWFGMSPAPPPGLPIDQGAATNPVPQLYTDDVRIPQAAGWDKHGQVALQQNLPLPLQLLDVVPEYLPGDSPETNVSPRAPGTTAPKGAPVPY